jgi:protein SCO1/2
MNISKLRTSKALVGTILLCLAANFLSVSMAHAARGEYRRTIENYSVPDVTLVNQDGAKVKLRSLLSSKKVVMVDFIFTTCTTICPVLSAGFSSFQRKLGGDMTDVHLVSISIDPENDTPKKMKEYLKRYNAKPGWDFLTGSSSDIRKVLAAFDVSTTDDKMFHQPLALFHSARKGEWVRIFGLIGTSDYLAEYRTMRGQ